LANRKLLTEGAFCKESWF